MGAPDPGWEGGILVLTILGRGFCDAANTEKSRGAHKKSLFAWLPFHAALESAFKSLKIVAHFHL